MVLGRVSRSSERWFAFAYGLWLFGTFAYFMPAATWNPVSRFDLTRAIVEERTLSIDSYAENTGDRAKVDGRWYSEKSPVPSILAAPAYAVFHVWDRLRGGRPQYVITETPELPARRLGVNHSFQQGLYVCSLSTAGLGTAIAGVLLFELLRRRFSPGAALLGSAAAILGTPLFPYATSFYGHAIAASFLVAAVAALALVPDRDPPVWRVRVAGACLVLAAGSEYIAAVPAAVIGVAFLAVSPRRQLLYYLRDLAAGAVLPLALLGAYHWACFGAPWRTGYPFVQRAEFAQGHASGLLGVHLPTLEGLSGLLFGERRGLLPVSPVAALALPLAAWDAFRRRDLAARAGLLALFSLLLANAGYYMWWGGAAAGPRHLVPALAFLGFGAAVAWRAPKMRWLVVIVLTLSVANAFALTAVGLEAPERGNLLLDYAYPRLLRGQISVMSGASNLALRLGLPRAIALIPIALWLALGAYFLARRVREWTSVQEPDQALPLQETKVA
jgi:hypothetical protein